MDLARIAKTRHTCKAYDPTRRIPAEQFEQLKTLLCYSPSSVNSQPWHFFIADSDAAKARITASMPEGTFYAANRPRVLNASHVIALCARTRVDDAHIETLLDQEQTDGRFPTAEGREVQKKSRRFYVGLHHDPRDMQAWTQKQVYLALGTLLLGAATLGIDATPIEGFDPDALDKELGLAAQGLRSTVLVALGYRSADDFNAGLPKSRLGAAQVMTTL